MIFSVTLFRSQGRRSVYLAKLLQRRATVEELRERGIIRENAVFGCALEHQTLHSTNTSQVPSLSLNCPLSVLSESSSLIALLSSSGSGVSMEMHPEN